MFGKALGKRSEGGSPSSGIAFESKTGQLTNGAQVRRLEPRAAAVLSCLSEAGGAVVSRQELLDGCWGIGHGSDEALTQAVAQIRRAFEELGASQPIETLAKRGYRLIEPLNRQAKKSVRAPRTVALMTVTLIMLLALAYLQPHGFRHFIRHNLGLGFAGSGQ